MLSLVLKGCRPIRTAVSICNSNLSQQCDRVSLGLRFNSSNSAAYAGDGKTTVNVLNNDEDNLNLINTYSHKGFRLSNNLFITGSILLFPTNVFAWNVRRGADINLESLLLFDLVVPKVKIIIIGYGQRGEQYDSSLPMKLKRKGISCEMLPTPHAVTTYNYLVCDAVHVAGAFLPVKDEVKSDVRDTMATKGLEFLKEKEIVPAHHRSEFENIDTMYDFRKKAQKHEDEKEKVK